MHTEGKRMIHKRAGTLGGAEKGRAEYGRDKKKNMREFRPEGSQSCGCRLQGRGRGVFMLGQGGGIQWKVSRC